MIEAISKLLNIIENIGLWMINNPWPAGIIVVLLAVFISIVIKYLRSKFC